MIPHDCIEPLDAIVRNHLPPLAGHRRTLSPAAGAAQPASPGWSAHPAPSRRAPGGGEGTELVDRNPQEPSGPAWARKKPRPTREGRADGQEGADAKPPPRPQNMYPAGCWCPKNQRPRLSLPVTRSMSGFFLWLYMDLIGLRLRGMQPSPKTRRLIRNATQNTAKNG